MKITKQSINKFFSDRGFGTKEKREAMSSEEIATIAAAFKEEFGEDMTNAISQAMNGNTQTELTSEEVNQIRTSLSQVESIFGENTNGASGSADDENGNSAGASGDNSIIAGINKLIGLVGSQKEQIEALSGEQETGKPKNMGQNTVAINSVVHSKTHLFGIETDMFSMSKPWNMVTSVGKELEIISQGTSFNSKWEHYEKAFKDDFQKYASSFADRINTLHAEGTLGNISSSAIDFTGFEGTGWGEQYIVRRQDALIAYIRELESVRTIFPVRYGVQDKMEMTNSFLTSFSQAYQSGRVFKGKHKIQPMLADVKDAMFKHSFDNMKEMEKEYIGYLNREGSSPIKWSMVEWLMQQILVSLNNEWNERRVLGRRVEPVKGKAGHYMFASTGVVPKMKQYIDELYLEPFEDLGKYTRTTILDYVEILVEKVNKIIPSLNGHNLYMNKKHVPWYLQQYRKEYGKDFDFDGVKYSVKDYDLSIVPVPHMKNSTFMWITLAGNIELYELEAGEMANFIFQTDLEELIVASYWKEGSGAYMVGEKHKTIEDLKAAKRKFQYIFCNNPKEELEVDATTADAATDNVFISKANTSTTVFSEFSGAEEGVVYRLICGSMDNATKTAKSGKWADISAWIPKAVGDYIEVYYDDETEKYIEVTRKVS
jgi:hypothetical protein